MICFPSCGNAMHPGNKGKPKHPPAAGRDPQRRILKKSNWGNWAVKRISLRRANSLVWYDIITVFRAPKLLRDKLLLIPNM